MPLCGAAGMMTPACAPSTPASHEPSLETGLPLRYEVVFSPRYMGSRKRPPDERAVR
jgi:hypothetical protein